MSTPQTLFISFNFPTQNFILIATFNDSDESKDDSKLYTPTEIADIIFCEPSLVRMWIRDGKRGIKLKADRTCNSKHRDLKYSPLLINIDDLRTFLRDVGDARALRLLSEFKKP